DADHLVEIPHRQPRDPQRLAADVERAVDDGPRQMLELRAAHLEGEIERTPPRAVPNFAQGDRAPLLDRELLLQDLGAMPEPFEGGELAAGVDVVLGQELVRHLLRDDQVEVVAAEEAVAGGGQDFEDVVREVEEGDIEGPTAKIVDGDALAATATKAVCERRRRGLVQDAEHLQTGDATGDLRGGALQVVEVGGHRDHGTLDPPTEGSLRD